MLVNLQVMYTASTNNSQLYLVNTFRDPIKLHVPIVIQRNKHHIGRTGITMEEVMNFNIQQSAVNYNLLVWV